MSEKLNVALVQTSIAWENPKQNRSVFSDKIALIASEVDLIILPEMFTTGFTMTPEHLGKEEGLQTLKWMQDIAAEKNAAILGSLPFFEKENYTNRLFFVHPNGVYEHYDKRHTFTLAGEDKVYKSGLERLIVDFRGFRICPMVCYDLRFPVWARNTNNYDVLVFVANWPKPRITAWDTLLKARAIENMTYCIGVNRIGTDQEGHEYIGHSAAYDCLGAPLAFSEKEDIVLVRLSKEHVKTTRAKLKFLEDKDDFTLQL